MIRFRVFYSFILTYALKQNFFLLNFNRFQLLKGVAENAVQTTFKKMPKNFSINDIVNRGKTPKNREFLLGHSWANLPLLVLFLPFRHSTPSSQKRRKNAFFAIFRNFREPHPK